MTHLFKNLPATCPHWLNALKKVRLMKRIPLRCSEFPPLLLMVDTFPRVGDQSADELTLNYKHFAERRWKIEVYCFACKATVCLNSTKMDTVPREFISCARNINEHVYSVCTFSRQKSAQSQGSLFLAAVPLITKVDGPAKDFVDVVRAPASTGWFCCR